MWSVHLAVCDVQDTEYLYFELSSDSDRIPKFSLRCKLLSHVNDIPDRKRIISGIFNKADLALISMFTLHQEAKKFAYCPGNIMSLEISLKYYEGH